LLPERRGSGVSVTLGYGGAAAAYARRQHEDLTFAHKEGQEAKFLERPLLEMKDEGRQMIIDAIQEEEEEQSGSGG